MNGHLPVVRVVIFPVGKEDGESCWMKPRVKPKKMLQPDATSSLISELIRERILLLDGAMGTMIQRLKFDEAAVRGDRFADHHKDLKNFADILCLTHPEAITEIHRGYLEAGSDIVETNSFGASPVGMLEFELPLDLVDEINRAAVTCARRPPINGATGLPISRVSSPVPSAPRRSRRRSARRSTIQRIATRRSRR